MNGLISLISLGFLTLIREKKKKKLLSMPQQHRSFLKTTVHERDQYSLPGSTENDGILGKQLKLLSFCSLRRALTLWHRKRNT